MTSLLHTLTQRPSEHLEAGQKRPLILVPRDSDPVEASTLWLVSPLVREVMASVAGEDKVILLPDFEKEDVTRGLALLSNSGEDTMVFSAGVRSFLEAVGIDVSSSEVLVKPEPLEEEENTVKERNDSSEMSTDKEDADNDEFSENGSEELEENIEDEQNALEELIDNTDTQSGDIDDKHSKIGESTYDPEKIDEEESEEKVESLPKIQKENVMKDNKSATITPKINARTKLTAMFSVSCPFCSSEFFGNHSKLRDKLKCHLGQRHFLKEMEIELKKYFVDSDKCQECSRIFASKSAKRKHLTFNHSEMVDKILDIAREEVSKAKSNVGNRDNSGSESLLQSDEDNSNHSTEAEMSVESEKVDENTAESPDEYEADLADVHKLLMDENSDSDSDEDEENTGSAETDQAVQNLLFQDQDFSDSDDEEEENQDAAMLPQNEPNVMEKVSAFISSIQKVNDEMSNKSKVKTPETLDEEIDEKMRQMVEIDGNSSKCTVCKKTGKYFNIFRHAERHVEGYKHPCKNCSYISNTRPALREHVRTKHNK